MLDLVRDAANPIAIAATMVSINLNLVAKGSAVRLSYFITTLEHPSVFSRLGTQTLHTQPRTSRTSSRIFVIPRPKRGISARTVVHYPVQARSVPCHDYQLFAQTKLVLWSYT